MQIKQGVHLHSAYAMAFALLVCEEVLAKAGGAIITSGEDGQHSKGSLHYEGRALDFRSKHLYNPKKAVELLKLKLGPDYDVLFEAEGQENEHIHVEFDPKWKKEQKPNA